jgi:hypothetical protein
MNNRNLKLITLLLTLVSLKNQLLLAASPPPNWTINAASFQYTENVTAQLYVAGTLNNATGNMIGAFVGNSLRGVGTPQIIAGKAYYFFTLYANQTAGETVIFKAYIAATDEIKPILETTPFVYNGILGSFTTPFALHTTNGTPNAPPMLASIPRDTTLAGIAFPNRDLLPYFSSTDNDPVVWSTLAGTHLNASINASKVLTVNPIDANWTGTDTVQVRVTETTSGALSAYRTVYFTVLPDYAGPNFTSNPSQTRALGAAFANFDLDNFLTSGSPCLQHQVALIPFMGFDPMPNWSLSPGGAGSMLVTVRMDFGDNQPLAGSGHKLAAFMGNTLAGLATPTLVGGKNYYFLVVNNVGNGMLNFKFFDTVHSKLYTRTSNITFVPNGTFGTVNVPHLIQLSPLIVTTNTNGFSTVTVLDPTWTGVVNAQFTATDCDYPLQKNDVQLAEFRVGILNCPTPMCIGVTVVKN